MAYQKKYWFQFTSLDGKVNVVELWQNTASVLTAEEVDGGAVPFIVQMPGIDHKFQPVRGTGCEINMISSTDRKFFTGIYHTYMKEFVVKHYIDSALNWIGYLNSEMVRESYSEYSNYPFQITGNDGFALLERLNFCETNGAYYNDIKSLFDILQICIGSIGLPFEKIYISLSTTFTGQDTTPGNSLLHQTYVICSNFYNEDNEPETMRKVIDSILAPFGAVITQIAGDIWITDVNTLAQGSADFARYTQSTGAYIDTVTVDLTKDISDIGYMGTGSEIEMSGGKNKQVVSYSPYPLKTAVPEFLVNLTGISPDKPPYAYQTDSYHDNGSLKYFTLTPGSGFSIYSPAEFMLSYRNGSSRKVEEEKDASTCLYWRADASASHKVFQLENNQVVSLSAKVDSAISGNNVNRSTKLKISGEINLNLGITKTKGVGAIALKSVVKIGSNYAKSDAAFLAATTNTWGTSAGYHYIKCKLADGSDIIDQWVPFEWDVPDYLEVTTDLTGLLYFELYSDYEFLRFDNTLHTNTTDWDNSIRIRKLAISVVDGDTKEEVGKEDREYTGYMDATIKEEAEKIELIVGTDVTTADRGKLMKYTGGQYQSIPEFIRHSQTYRIELLLLNSLVSNYRFGYLTISGLKLENKFHQLNAITDTGIISGKKFMVKQLSCNYRDNTIDVDITEVTEDSLTIVPNE